MVGFMVGFMLILLSLCISFYLAARVIVHRPGESSELLAAHADGNALKISRPFFGYRIVQGRRLRLSQLTNETLDVMDVFPLPKLALLQ